MSVWIAQLKCPQNHCVSAVASELPDSESGRLESALMEGFNALVERGLVNRECGLCKSKDLHVEIAKSRFETMEEALPALHEEQRQQLATAAFLRSSRN